MTPEVTLTQRGYQVGDRVLPRVSTILGELSKPGLDAWKKSVGFEEAERVVKAASELGTRVHAACETLHQGVVWEPTAADTDLAPFIDAYTASFHAEVAAVELVEQTVYSLRLGYGGTLDLLARMKDSRRLLLDVKTSKRLNDSMPLQLSAYALAIEEMGLGEVDGRAIIHLPSNRPGTVRLIEYGDSEQDALTWRCLVQLYRWRQVHKNDWRE